MSDKLNIAAINELRQKTGAPMNKCKEAILAVNGDVKEAEIWLRKQDIKPGVSERSTGEGTFALAADEFGISLVELSCETDFAARNQRFIDLAQTIVNVALKQPTDDLAALLAAPIRDTSVADLIKTEISVGIKENIQLKKFKKYSAVDPSGLSLALGYYLHTNRKLAVVVGVSTHPDLQEAPIVQEVLKDIAMHVAGASPSPLSVNIQDLPADEVAKEKAFIQTKLVEDPAFAKKPDNIKAKIVEGKMGRFYKDRVLLEQPFVKNPEITVGNYLAQANAHPSLNAGRCDRIQMKFFDRHAI